MRLTVPASWTRRGRPGPRGKGVPPSAPIAEAADAPLPARKRAPRVRLNLEPSEDDIQIALFKQLAVRAHPGVEYWHVPNGGARSKPEAARFKAMGVRAGMQDVHLLYCGLLHVLELKRRKGGRLSPEQKVMAARMAAAGAKVAVAAGLDAALVQLEAWRLIKPDRSRS